MMARAIDADEVMNKMQEGYDDAYGTERAIWLEAMKKIKELPTIEAEPVNHGKVIERLEDGKFKRCCSCCDEDLTVATMWTVIQYCPYCGARMDGE